MTQVPLRVKITKKVYLARKGHDLFQMSRHLSISFLWWVWKCRTRDSSNSNRYCHTSQSAEDSEQKIFISIVVIVVAILFFFGNALHISLWRLSGIQNLNCAFNDGIIQSSMFTLTRDFFPGLNSSADANLPKAPVHSKIPLIPTPDSDTKSWNSSPIH